MKCDICTRELKDKEGYLLTTEQVVSTPAYWNKAFSNPMYKMLASNLPEDKAKEMFASQMASMSTAWMVCDDCINLFPEYKEKAKEYAVSWYESGGSITPPGTGAVPYSKVNMGTGGSGPCFIATAAFTDSSPEVEVLRNIRDRVLSQSPAGRKFIAFYYQYSPSLAEWITVSSLRKQVVRWILYPVVKVSKLAIGRN